MYKFKRILEEVFVWEEEEIKVFLLNFLLNIFR